MKAHETWAFGFGRRRVYDLRIIATTISIIGAGDCGRLRSCHHLPICHHLDTQVVTAFNPIEIGT